MIWTKITFIFCGKPNCVNRLGVLIKLKQHAFWRVFFVLLFWAGLSLSKILIFCVPTQLLRWNNSNLKNCRNFLENMWVPCFLILVQNEKSFLHHAWPRYYFYKRTLHSSTTQRLLKQRRRSRRKKKARAALEWRPRLAECPRRWRRPRGRPPLACLSKEPLACLRSRESPIESPGMGLPHQESVVRIVCYAIKIGKWDWIER